MTTAEQGPHIIVALDFPKVADALNLVSRLDPKLCRVKIGKELFTRGGPQVVEKVIKSGFDVFLDLKFHDIPNTVAGACVAAADLGVWMMNVHASGGRKMMEAARQALGVGNTSRPLLIAVTILTSLSEEDISEIGFSGSPKDNVERLARLTQEAGLDGVVCSPLETQALRTHLGNDFLLVTPGVRPAGFALGDQQRVMTPAEAMEGGSSYLVIGRPVTQAADPVAVLQAINTEIRGLTRA